MPIPSANLPAAILLSELDLQCKIILRAAPQLQQAAAHWKCIDQGIDDGTTAPPIDIISTCTVVLSSAAAISRLLFVGKRNGKEAVRIDKRCKTLMALLKQPTLSAIRTLAVRNSWEHLDERLDDVLAAHTYRSFAEIHVAVTPPDPRTFVSRHFDPTSLAVRHGPDSTDLQPLITECTDLVTRIQLAFNTLQSELHAPYKSVQCAAA